MASVNYKREINGSFKDVMTRTENALKAEGLSVVTRIDFDQLVAGQDLPPLTILGACNPDLAYQAFTQNPDVTTFMPCNVVVRQISHDTISVEVARPTALVEPLNDDEIYAIGYEAEEKLKSALERI